MEKTETHLRKEYRGLKSAWNKLKAIFTTRSADAQLAGAATTTAPIAAASIPPEQDKAAVTPRESVASSAWWLPLIFM
jgi:hypothetical protein